MNYYSYLRGGKKSMPEEELPAALEYLAWDMVPPSVWTWKNFTARELACKGTGRIRLQRKALDALQALRDEVGKPMLITSAYRSPEHNAAVGGSPTSRHMFGDAFDVVMVGHDPKTFEEAARRAGFRGFGYYPESSPPFMHIDMGPARKWGTPFNPKDTNNEA